MVCKAWALEVKREGGRERMREGKGKENMERMREQKEGGQDFSENIPSRKEGSVG